MEKVKKFAELGLSEKTLRAIRKKGFEEPTQIQARCIPLLLQDDINVIGQAQTGTGKTAAFGLPIIEKIAVASKGVRAIVLTPTRELAIQVTEELNSLKGDKNLKITTIYGGQSIEQQIRRLKKGVHIVVGTPGRVIDHLNRGTLLLDAVEYAILDEADEMLNMGFIDDVEIILKHTPEKKRTLLFSATMPRQILKLAKKYMPRFQLVEVEKTQLTAELTEQIYFEVRSSDKFEALTRILDIEPDFYGLVFCRTKVDADTVANGLVDRGYDAEALHGDLSQKQRELIFRKFKNRRINVLVATDVAARGLDVSDLTHVINYSLPQDPESYVHRIGRTGRAGKEGTAITFITPAEYQKLVFIKKKVNTTIRREKLPAAKDIIRYKKDKIRKDIEDEVLAGELKEYHTMAEDILMAFEPHDVVAAMLRMHYEEELDIARYRSIRQTAVDEKGKTRLFVARGKKDKMDKRKLLAYLADTSGIDKSRIQEVKIYDTFSFVSVPFREAEVIIDVFKRNRRGKRPVVVKANQKK